MIDNLIFNFNLEKGCPVILNKSYPGRMLKLEVDNMTMIGIDEKAVSVVHSYRAGKENEETC